MNRSFLLSIILTSMVVVGFQAVVCAAPMSSIEIVHYRQQDDQQQKEKKDVKKPVKKEKVEERQDITEVPKARKQSRPPVVAKPKVKPVKVVRPKIRKP